MSATLVSLFLVGLLGGVHCVGMCGGIVSALSMGQGAGWSRHLAYNGGRIAAYCVAGAMAGTLGGAGIALAGQWHARLILWLAANLMLLAMGMHLLGMTRVLGALEAQGGRLWKRLQPMSRRFLPVRSWRQALPLGFLWGWLPCGLVYSALATALAAGSAGRGAAAMLAFGLGTLPNLLLAGLVLARLQGWVRRPGVRVTAGLLILGFAVYGLWSGREMAAILWSSS